MRDIIMLIGIFIVGYIVSMGVLYVAFRIFFPVVVEKDESTLKVGLRTENAGVNVLRNSSMVRTNTQLPRINLAHG